MSLFDLIPGIVGDRLGNAVAVANRDRVACVFSDRVEFVEGNDFRVVAVVSRRSVKAPPLDDRTVKVPALPPRLAKLPDEEKC
jgi:hypothetical protein